MANRPDAEIVIGSSIPCDRILLYLRPFILVFCS